jgi:hypothetical protein
VLCADGRMGSHRMYLSTMAKAVCEQAVHNSYVKINSTNETRVESHCQKHVLPWWHKKCIEVQSSKC